MACGTPVIAYPEGSVPEVIDEGTTGFMVRSIDEAGAALGKARMLDRTALRQRFEQRFSAQRMASDYVALYRRLACTARFRPLISLPHVRRTPQIEVGAR
jgi:glycosyltransferase involved in cell wall biosynthesis